MGVGEVRFELLGARHVLRDAPTGRLLESDETMETAIGNGLRRTAEAGLYLGSALHDMLPDYLTHAGAIKEAADTAHEIIEAAGQGSDSGHIQAALTGTAEMSRGYEEVITDTAAMRERLETALGHLSAFASEMEAFEALHRRRSVHESVGISGGRDAAQAIAGYITSQGQE